MPNIQILAVVEISCMTELHVCELILNGLTLHNIQAQMNMYLYKVSLKEGQVITIQKVCIKKYWTNRSNKYKNSSISQRKSI